MNNVKPILEAKDISKSFHDVGDNDLSVLKQVNLQVFEGESVAIIGASGSGKTTLLQLLGGLASPNDGTVLFKGLDFAKQNEKTLCCLRNQEIGFIYQFHYLLPELTAVDNVAMPMYLNGLTSKQARTQAIKVLQQVGLDERLLHKPSQLSGGERQRVAIGRAIINNPICLLADEPTGNLDDTNAEETINLMLNLNKNLGSCLVINTHDNYLASKMDKKLHLLNGVLVQE